MATATVPWVEKYRPETLDNVMLHHTDTLRTLMDQERWPHTLFYGPPGTGKTTTIIACARHMYGSEMRRMTLILNASDDNGVAVIRDRVKTFAESRPLALQWDCQDVAVLSIHRKPKLVILDEADGLTAEAQFALRQIIEKHSLTTRFCLLCNTVSKVVPALQSRCTRFRFRPLEPRWMVQRLAEVASKESLVVDTDTLQLLVSASKGDMRQCLNALQASATAADGRPIDANDVCAAVGIPQPTHVTQLLHSLRTEELRHAVDCVRHTCQHNGYALVDVVRSVADAVVTTVEDVPTRAKLTRRLAALEHRLAGDVTLEVHEAALAAAFSF